jgi:hypothetical protein
MLEQITILANNRNFWFDLESHIYEWWLDATEDFDYGHAINWIIGDINYQEQAVKQQREVLLEQLKHATGDYQKYLFDMLYTYNHMIGMIDGIRPVIASASISPYSLDEKQSCLHKVCMYVDMCADKLAIQIGDIIDFFETKKVLTHREEFLKKIHELANYKGEEKDKQ